jgi:predicted nicotinamide N-methyase
MSEPQTKLNLPSSPAARAFFAALDSNQSNQSFNTSSDFIKKRILTLGWRNRYSQDDRYPMSVQSCRFSVTQVQRGEVDGTYGTGATVWPAAVVMIKYLERQKHLIHGKAVVDLGSGTGITSIAAALLGAKHVVCTDGEPSVVELAHANVRSVQAVLNDRHDDDDNQLKRLNQDSTSQSNLLSDEIMIQDCPVAVQKYWWGKDRLRGRCGNVDVVLVADCVLPKLYPIEPLVDAIDQLLVSPEAMTILSYEHRHYPDFDPKIKFQELCSARGLCVTVIPIDEQDTVYSVDDIEIWHVQRSDSSMNSTER